MLAWLAPILVFGLVVFVHELGHFMAAKAFGVYAPRFSIGFGPALFKWRRGETEYKLAAFPLGGYVRMASRQDAESAFLEGGSELGPLPPVLDPDAMIPFGPKPIPEHRWFESKPLYARLIIMLAGVTMNLVLGWVVNVSSVALYTHDLTTRVSEVVPGHPAARAGILPGDSVVSVNGHTVPQWEWLYGYIGQSAGEQITLGIVRRGKPLVISVTPLLDSAIDPETGEKTTMGKVGMAASVDPRHVPFGRAIREGTEATGAMATLVFTSLRKIVTRETPVSDLGGPIEIAHASVQAARAGAQELFWLIALISVNLAVFNLLPIPILDGGQIVVQVVEAMRGEPLTLRAREYVGRIGLVLILVLFLTVTFNDLKRLLLAMLGKGAG